ncbi:gamma-glutamyl phosphate reductase [candidate division MSBL1 archaeon SCGC-AAA259D14]|uniref:Gamma-glutamyl phosphate reductase n=4 Tax=candidate division MSBL1 TaxID=215777 RepID=A0A133U2R9_9EURY|nr:gamma-glutamyl phosphate reductase [candidate division MSBL1 archaeon SCGC-AAA259D14]KXA92693.1 gamma-glutamyl phosphate reductase [candidate division MSBL1 archaeon SCGC-AAA259E22]KXA95187.1 gamma-glutamyl phosphate reductase [candidate division MSBL1 archaeon SCGC-AAA259I07]KXA98387.1 gamma-glutamyl phosphate reductase [candidate division MSBL1 archaeon SCGC-AAA259J03]
MKDVGRKALEAEKAALKLANVSEEVRNEALQRVAVEIEKNCDKILEANEEDVDEAEKLLQEGEYSQAFVDRLKLDEGKIGKIAEMIRSVSGQEDPLGKTLDVTELDENLELYKVSVPIGVLGSIFESRPDVLPQVSSLSLKSGNSVILKGGSEAERSNSVLFEIIKETTEEVGIPEGWIQLIEARREVEELLEMDDKVDLLIPRGSKSFIRFIQENSRIPVLGHAEGVCHIYIDKEADLEKAVHVSYDGKVQYPAVCNAVETLLVHSEKAPEFLPRIAEKYEEAGVEMRGCEKTRDILEKWKVGKATEEDWKTEYLDLIISIKIVDKLEEAIDHINNYGSKHTDSIVSENKNRLLTFLESVDSSSVIANASTRFSDGYRYGLGAEVGISTEKIHARGPVGLEGLTTYKYYLIGNGHTVDTYSGTKAEPFTHKKIKKDWNKKKSL